MIEQLGMYQKQLLQLLEDYSDFQAQVVTLLRAVSLSKEWKSVVL